MSKNRLYPILLFSIVIAKMSFAQSDTLTWQEIIELDATADSMVIIKNRVIGKEPWPRFLEGVDSTRWHKVIKNESLSIQFEDCEFNYTPEFRNCKIRFNIYRCKKSNEFHVYSSYFLFRNSEIGLYFIHSQLYELKIRNCRIGALRIHNCKYSYVIIKNSIVRLNPDETLSALYFAKTEYSLIEIDGLNTQKLLITCDNGSIMNLNVNSSAIDTLDVNSFNSFNASNNSINKLVIDEINRIELNDNSFSRIDLSETQLDINKSVINWKDISGFKLISKSSSKYGIDSIITNPILFKEQIIQYSRLYALYKSQMSRTEANACYVEMKELETKRLAYVYSQNKTIDNWFNWQLNVFLKTFADYGTKPLKALYISFYIILVFAVFYFFFFSAWDQINRSFLVKKYRQFMRYLSSEQKMEDFYTERHKTHFQNFKDFKSEWNNKRGELPKLFFTLGKPLYHISLGANRATQWIYRNTEFLSGKWSDLPQRKKIFVSTTLSFGLIFYGVYLLLIKFINSFMLSLNAFTTLGFGEIPVKGLSRYLAIIEGFIGWFLLSIFSVSLISQILQ